MSGTTLVFAVDLEDVAPQALNRATAEPEEENLEKKWPLEESMYIRLFKDAISTILEHESFLFSEPEIIYLKRLQDLAVEPLYLLIRLSLRKDSWHRRSDYERYAAAMDHGNKLDTAIHVLCARQNMSQDIKSVIPVDGGQDNPIDLTCDSDEEELVPELKKPPGQEFTYHALSHEEASMEELLDILSAEELGKLAKDYNIKITGKKRKEIAKALMNSAKTQTTLSFFRSTPLQQANLNVESKSKSSSRLRVLCIKYIAHCIKINPQVLLLIRRINLLFFRTTTYEAQLFVPAILVACKKRKYSAYNAARSNQVFTSREDLLSYQAALALEAAIEDVLEKLQGPVVKKPEVTKERSLHETKLVEMFNELTIAFNSCLVNKRSDQRCGLERFEPGYIYVRTLYHIAFQIGKLRGVDVELEILGNLAVQDRWLLGKRGACYDRMACIYMKDIKNRVKAEMAYDLVVRALMDEETRLRYRPKLVRRLGRLENALDISAEERHVSEGKLEKGDEVYILGTRLDDLPEEEELSTQATLLGMLAISPGKKVSEKPAKHGSGKTLWEGEDGKPIGVEEFVLEYYSREGYKGKHCEGRITRFLFGLLFHDILFHPSIPGAFETAYQTAPLDLVHDTFYSARKELIDARLEEILIPGKALEIATARDEELREDNVFFVGGRWDTFQREELLEIVEYMPENVIHLICQLQAKDFEASGGGVPDLILWSVDKEEVRFVEVKSPSDKLSETQKLWIHHLVNAGAIVEVCHVETAVDREKRAAVKERNRERAKSRSRSKSVALTRRKKSVAESESEDDEEQDERSDFEELDLEEVKREEIEDVKFVRTRRKRSPVDDDSNKIRNKRIKTES